MSSDKLDCVIIGQGLAGTCLAWQFLWRGVQVLVIDREDQDSASRVAAGLMTPVTGQRLVPSWRLGEFWPAAFEFYRRVEAELEASFLLERGQIRLFSNQQEQERFANRDPAENREWITAPASVSPDEFHNEHGGFEIPRAARLNVAAFLEASRDHFQKLGLYRTANVDPREVAIDGETVELPRLGITARHLVFSQGFAAAENPWFSEVRFDATRGEILTLRIPGLTELRIVNRGLWLVPLGGDLFRAGATYDWDNLDAGPTEAGREELCLRLREFLKLPFEVVDHDAGVRPIVIGRHPIIGRHAEYPQLAIFNGLGSKGSLQAPLLARQLTELLLDEKPIEREVDVTSRFAKESASEKPANRPRLTELAHQAIAGVVKPGEVAIDATAGNGHDTCFLAKLVGKVGDVFALDCQAEAIQRTRRRLEENGLANVTLRQCDHAGIAKVIPAELAGEVAAVMFNLGYLPGGDKSIITRTESSVTAIRNGLPLLRSGGVLTVMAYPGHEGGNEETSTVEEFVMSLGSDFEITIETVPDRDSAPRLLIVRRV